MKKIILLLPFILLIACTQPTSHNSGFKKPEGLENAIIVPTDSIGTKIITINKPIDVINASDIIEDVTFIPIETTPESLIELYRKVFFYDDKIYILDDVGAEALFIFDNNGNFLRTIGTKGQGPEEFSVLSGMCIDKKNNNILLYDNGKNRIMYYDLDGNYLKNAKVNYRHSEQFAILPSGNLIAIANNFFRNFHLNKFDRYRLIYSDTTRNIQKFGFEFDDNVNLYRSWSTFFFNDDELLFYQQYTNSIYRITENSITEKYRIDCSNFTPFDIKMISGFNNDKEFKDYWYSKTNLAPYMGENINHLYFDVEDKGERYTYFYDKRSGNYIGFKKMNYDTEFFNAFNTDLFSYNDYFIGKAPTEELMKMKELHDKSGKPFPDKINKMIETFKDDDNDVLIMFKIKEL